MPVAPRLMNSKATKIAFKILGKPENLKKQHLTPFEVRIKQRLAFEASTKVK